MMPIYVTVLFIVFSIFSVITSDFAGRIMPGPTSRIRAQRPRRRSPRNYMEGGQA
jgi:hypothetical protein